MFPTSKSIPDTSTYLRKKQPLIADQPPPPQPGEATTQEETGPQQQPRQPLPPRLAPPQPSSETPSLQRPASAPQITPSAQRNDASQGPPPSLRDVQPFQRHTASDQQQNLPRLAGSRIPQTTIHYRLPDAPAPQSSTARSPEVRQDAVRSQISSPSSTTPATVQPPLRPPQTAQATYLRRLTELGQPLGALPRILQPQPGPLSAATRPPYATPTAAQSRDQSTPQQPSSTAVGSPHLDAGSPRPPGMPPVAAPPSLPDPVQEQQKLEKQAAISKNLTLQQQREKQRQDRLRGQGAGQAQQLAQQEAQLQPAQQRLEAARQTHAAFAGAPVRYENRGGSLVRIQSDASGMQKTLPVDPANPQEMAQAANWTRQHASAKAELAAAEAAHAPLAAGVQGLKDQHQKLARQLIEEHRWARSMQQRMQHGASGAEGPPPPFTPTTADRHLLARLQAAGDPMAAAVKEEMTPPAVRQFQGRLDTAAPATPMTLLDVVTGGTPGSGARATPAEATAARDLTMKSMGVMDPKNVQLTPLPDGTQALHRPRSGSSAPLAIYDPKQKSLTVQAQNGVLSEEARRMVRNIAGPPGSALESSMPVYFGHGPHATEAEFSSLVEAGKQAHEAARTPEERAAALGKLGLSPAGVKKQLEAGTLSFQQGRLLNGAFNGVMEHDSTLPGTQAALDEWVSRPKNQHMAQWLHEGTPEQRAYVAGQFFKQTRHRAEGSLLATPERMEEVRRGHLGGLHPDWGKPGAAAPGSAPDDGPAGLERIPLQGGGAAHMPSGTWTAHDYETLDQHPDIRKLPHAEREAAVDTLLSQYHEQLTSQPGFNAADQQKFHQTAQALRDRVAALKTWGDTAGEGADLVKDAAKSEVGTHLAAGADLSIFDPYGNLRPPGKNLKEQSVYEAQKVKDTTQRLAQPAAEKKIDAALQAIHQDIRNGSFPLAPGEAQDKWIDELSAKLNPQRQQWFDAVQGPADPNTPEGKKHLAHLQQQTLASPENRALLQEFIRTGNMARWKELEHNLKKTPQRAQTEEDQQNSLKNDPLVRGLSNAAGTDLGEYMQGAPGTVAGYFVPGMGSLGKGSRMGRLARRAAGIAANIGGTVAQNTIENPDSDFEDHKRAVIADYVTSLGMKPFDHAKGKIIQKIKENLPFRRGAGNPGSTNSAPPPSEGQTFEERLALEDGSMPFTPTDTAQPQPGDATGQPPPSSQQPIPDTTTPTTPGSSSEKQPSTTVNNSQSPQTPASPPAPAANLPQVGQVLDNIQRLQDKAKDGPLSLAEQRELDHNEKVLAHTRVKNLEKEQQVIRSLPQPRELDPHKTQKLEEARAVLQRPVPGEPPASSPEALAPENSTRSSSDSDQPTQRVGDALSGRAGGLATAVAEVSSRLNTQVPGLLHDKTEVFHSVEDLLKSEYAKRHPFSQAELDQLHSAEGFHDPKTGHSAIIAGNVELHPGETPHDALTRVILHERVGHDGLQTLLGSKDSKAQKHWEGLTQRIKPEELNAIASQEGYQHLAGDRNALAHEWFARQAEKSPHLLKQPGLLRDMWEMFKGQFRKMTNNWKDTDESHLDTHLHELLRLSRNAALTKSVPSSASASVGPGAPARQFSISGKSSQFSGGTGGSIYQQEHRQPDAAEKSFSRPTEADILAQKTALEVHRKSLEAKRSAPRNTQDDADLLKGPDERVRNAQPASEALHRHNDAGSLVKTRSLGDFNEANLLEAPDESAVVHKPDNGQSTKKIRAGIAPEKTGHREVAASKIAQALGIDLVPPTTLMTHKGRTGSAQVFKKGMVNGEDANDPKNGHNIKIDANTDLPEGLPPDVAHDWQMMDDLLLHGDRHRNNYMLRVKNGKIEGAALVDNGHSLPDNTGIIKKRHPGPLEGQPISPLNEARLHRMLDNEASLRKSLAEHLEPDAIHGLFARAKALLARGKYGNFTLDEINAHLPPDKQRTHPVDLFDISQ